MTIGHFILIKLNNGHLGVRMSQALLKARDLDEKAERRRTILRAANALLDIRRQTLPPASAIAATLVSGSTANTALAAHGAASAMPSVSASAAASRPALSLAARASRSHNPSAT